MANNKMYENYLMHYRTKGALNGETKYPGKYIPIGKKAMAPLASITESHKIKYPEPLEKPTLNSVFNGITKGATSKSQREREAEAARRANQQAVEQRRIAGGGSGMSRTANAKPILSGTQAVGMRGVGAYNNANKKYPFDAEAYARRQESIKDLNQNAAEARRIKGGNPYVNQREENRKAAEARRISGGNPYVNQREENRKAAEARRIAGGSQGTITRAEAARRANQQAVEQRRIAGGSGVSASQRQKEAEARRIAGGSQGTITTAEAKRKNINDWYGNQVRGGNQSAAETRRIKGGTSGATTTTQAAESEKKKKKLKNVLKALLKSNSHGISRFL